MTDSLPIATSDGYFVSQEHKRIAEIIADYDPELRLVFIPPKDRDSNDPTEKPWAVAHFPESGPPYLVFFADECDERILERLFLNDTQRNDVGARLEASEAAAEAIKLKKQMEQQEEMDDMARFLWQTPLHNPKHNGKEFRL